MIGAGLGYLAGGLVVVLAWAWWLRHGRRVSDDMARDMIARAEDASRGLRWTYGPWRSERMKVLTEEGRSGFWMWLPITLFLPIFAVVLLASAAVEFAR